MIGWQLGTGAAQRYFACWDHKLLPGMLAALIMITASSPGQAQLPLPPQIQQTTIQATFGGVFLPGAVDTLGVFGTPGHDLSSTPLSGSVFVTLPTQFIDPPVQGTSCYFVDYFHPQTLNITANNHSLSFPSPNAPNLCLSDQSLGAPDDEWRLVFIGEAGSYADIHVSSASPAASFVNGILPTQTISFTGSSNAQSSIALFLPFLQPPTAESLPFRITSLQVTGQQPNFGVASSINRQGFAAEPVNTASGNYYFQTTDLSFPGRGLPFAFTRSYNALDSYSGPLGPGWTHSYNTHLTVGADASVSIKHGDGHQETYASVGGGSFTSQTPRVFSSLQQASDGNYILTDRHQTQIRFNSGGFLTEIVDRNGNSLSFFYDAAGNLVQITDTAGRATTLTYANNLLTSITDPAGRIVSYGYDSSGNLVSRTDPAGGTQTYTYDANHRITQINDERSTVLVANTYDKNGRVVQQINGRGLATTFSYGAGQTTFTDPLGNPTTHVYDDQMRLVQIVDALGGTKKFSYDASNNITSITHPNGHTSTFTYDGRGNPTALTDALGRTSQFGYDARNNLVSARRPSGATYGFSYDPHSNLLALIDPLGGQRTFSYDAAGELVSRTDPLGNQTSFGYDNQGNLTSIVDASGARTTLGYDAIGRRTALMDANGHVWTTKFNANSRVTAITDPLGNTTSLAYDPLGEIVALTDALGNATRYSYDETRNLSTVIDALGSTTSYGYDANNKRISVADANGHVTSSAYDSLGRLISRTDPLGHTQTYRYDAVGNLTGTTDARGVVNNFGYDPDNRLTQIAYGDGTTVINAYDVNGNRVSRADATGTTTYVYDALDRVVAIANPTGSLGYAYDRAGDRIALTYPDGAQVQYAYDASDRLSRLTDRTGQLTIYTYDPTGKVLKIQYPNGTSRAFAYDNANRLTTVTNAITENLFAKFTYTLDALGNKTRTALDGLSIATYDYDPMSRLIKATEPFRTGATTYSYDRVGNLLTSQRVLDYPIIMTYDAANELISETINNTTTKYTYDANGNLIGRSDAGSATYAYDAANRLVQVTSSTQTKTYQYDGDGNKVGAALGTSSSRFLNDVLAPVSLLLSENGSNGIINYVYGLDRISETGASFQNFYHTDGLGSVTDLTTAKGKPSSGYAYGPWGESVQIGLAVNRFRFTGEELDDFSGLYYLRARWYDPHIRRFVNRDAWSGTPRYPLSLNKYLYVFNNPINLTDRSGREPSSAASPSGTSSSSNAIISTLDTFFGSASSAIALASDSTLLKALGPLDNFVTVTSAYQTQGLSGGANELTQAILVNIATRAGQSAGATAFTATELGTFTFSEALVGASLYGGGYALAATFSYELGYYVGDQIVAPVLAPTLSNLLYNAAPGLFSP